MENQQPATEASISSNTQENSWKNALQKLISKTTEILTPSEDNRALILLALQYSLKTGSLVEEVYSESLMHIEESFFSAELIQTLHDVSQARSGI